MLAENVASRQENNTRKKTKNVTIKLNTLNQVSELKFFKYQPSQMITV